MDGGNNNRRVAKGVHPPLSLPSSIITEDETIS